MTGPPQAPDDDAHARHYVVALLAVLLACFGYFIPKPIGSDWVATSRAALTFALVEHGTIHIDRYHAQTGDKARFGGHYYTVGSIGPSLLAVPPYAAFRLVSDSRFVRALTWRYAPQGSPLAVRHNAALAVITFLVVSLPSALLATVLVLAAVRLGIPASHGFLVALTYALATAAFPYSRAFYQHQVAACCSVAGGLLLWRRAPGTAGPNSAAAGFLFGVALISEYSSLLIVGPLLLALRARLRDWRTLAAISAGAAVPLGIAAAYNMAAFGTVMPVSYRYHVSHAVHQRGVLGIDFPSPLRLYGLTIAPFRGLFFQSPVLLLTVYGLRLMWRDGGVRPLALLCANVGAGYLLFNASYEFWWGGSALGPRFLVAALPFVCLPLLFVWRRWWPSLGGRMALAALGTVSAANVWTLSITGREYPPNNVENPLWDHAVPLLLGGEIAPNYGMWVGLEGPGSLVPLFLWTAAVLGWLWFRTRTPRRPPRRRGERIDTVSPILC